MKFKVDGYHLRPDSVKFLASDFFPLRNSLSDTGDRVAPCPQVKQ